MELDVTDVVSAENFSGSASAGKHVKSYRKGHQISVLETWPCW